MRRFPADCIAGGGNELRRTRADRLHFGPTCRLRRAETCVFVRERFAAWLHDTGAALYRAMVGRSSGVARGALALRSSGLGRRTDLTEHSKPEQLGARRPRKKARKRCPSRPPTSFPTRLSRSWARMAPSRLNPAIT